jgi:hypothetical protein
MEVSERGGSFNLGAARRVLVKNCDRERTLVACTTHSGLRQLARRTLCPPPVNQLIQLPSFFWRFPEGVRLMPLTTQRIIWPNKRAMVRRSCRVLPDESLDRPANPTLSRVYRHN